MPVASNDAQLIAMLQKPIGIAVEYALDQAYDALKKHIDMALGSGGSVYQRMDEGGGLKGAWKKEGTQYMGAIIQQEMHFDNGMISFNPSAFQHASPDSYVDKDGYVHNVKNYGPVDNLAALIFEGGAGPLFGEGNWRQARDAWSPFLNEWRVRHTKWLKDGMRHAGL